MKRHQKPVLVAPRPRLTQTVEIESTSTTAARPERSTRRNTKRVQHRHVPASGNIPEIAPVNESRSAWIRHADSIDKLNRTDPNAALRDSESWLASEIEGGETEGIARAKRAHAYALRYLGQYAEALNEYDQCRAEFRAIGLIDEEYRTNPGYVTALRYIGRVDEGIALSLETLQYFERQNDTLEIARQHINLGVLYRRTGDLHRALESYRTSLKLAQELGDLVRQAMSCMNMGNLLADMGEFEPSLRALNDALGIYRVLGQRNAVARVLMNIGRLQTQRGELGAAITTLQESRRWFRRMKVARDRAFVDLYLLRAYMGLNLRREALRTCRSAIAALTTFEMPYELGQALLALATLLEGGGKVDQALREASKARDVFDGAGNHLWREISQAQVTILGTRVRRSIPIATAIDEINDARDTIEEFGAREWVGRLHLYAGDLNERARRVEAAADEYLNAIHIGEAIGSDELIYRGHWALGLVSEDQPDTALDHYRIAAVHVERLRLRSRANELKISFIGDKTPLYEAALNVLLAESPDRVDQIFEFAERGRSRSIADNVSLAVTRDDAPDSEEAKLRARLAELRARVNALYDEGYGTGSATGADPTNANHDRIDRIERDIERTRQHLNLVRPSADHSALVGIADLQRGLSAQSAALVYFEARRMVQLLLVRPDSAQIVPDLAPVEVIRRLGRRIQFHLGKAAYGSDYLRENIVTLREGLDGPLQTLWELLLAPVSVALESANALLVLPSTSTYGLPFHAFLNKGIYALERFAVHYSPSATVECISQQRAEPQGGPLLLVAIDDPTLPGVRREVDQIASIVPNSVSLVDRKATVAAFRHLAQGAAAVHIATHGVFRADNPAFSGIKLADGWITAADLAEICRDSALITLSACETGMGSDAGGGEIMGMSQTILGSGCQSLISSLWTADDQSTVQLMTDFYADLTAGARAPMAMQRAMLAARSRDDHPYFWAPFAVFGDGSLVKTSGSD